MNRKIGYAVMCVKVLQGTRFLAYLAPEVGGLQEKVRRGMELLSPFSPQLVAAGEIEGRQQSAFNRYIMRTDRTGEFSQEGLYRALGDASAHHCE